MLREKEINDDEEEMDDFIDYADGEKPRPRAEGVSCLVRGRVNVRPRAEGASHRAADATGETPHPYPHPSLPR